MKKVSLIIPVYNVEPYLARCLDSVINQSFEEFEVILINDGSTDNSGLICDQYAQKDSRFHVIHTKNAGVSTARNKGLEVACSKYIAFLDSDDELEKDYLKHLMESDAELVISGVMNIDAAGNIHHKLQYSKDYIKKIENIHIQQMIENKSLNFIYAKRYKQSIIEENNIRFDINMDLSEDGLFLANYLTCCNSIQYKNNISYRYYKYNTKTLSSFNAEFVSKLKKANEIIVKKLNTRFDGIIHCDEWAKRRWSVYYYSIFFILREWDAPKKEKRKLLEEILRDPEFKTFSTQLDYYMQNDSKLIRKVLQTRSVNLLLIVWNAIEIKKNLDSRKVS